MYFDVFDHLVTESKEAFFFRARSAASSPLDNLNALLSFLYTLLTNTMLRRRLRVLAWTPLLDTCSATVRGRPSLALDLVEELRPVIADRLAISLINRRQIKPEGFHTTESPAR